MSYQYEDGGGGGYTNDSYRGDGGYGGSYGGYGDGGVRRYESAIPPPAEEAQPEKKKMSTNWLCKFFMAGGKHSCRNGDQCPYSHDPTQPPPNMNSWICKFCNNVNFWQRTRCNMRSCGKSRYEKPENDFGNNDTLYGETYGNSVAQYWSSVVAPATVGRRVNNFVQPVASAMEQEARKTGQFPERVTVDPGKNKDSEGHSEPAFAPERTSIRERQQRKGPSGPVEPPTHPTYGYGKNDYSGTLSAEAVDKLNNSSTLMALAGMQSAGLLTPGAPAVYEPLAAGTANDSSGYYGQAYGYDSAHASYHAAHAPAQYTTQQQPQYAPQQHAPQAQFAPPPAYMQSQAQAPHQHMPRTHAHPQQSTYSESTKRGWEGDGSESGGSGGKRRRADPRPPGVDDDDEPGAPGAD